MEKMKAHCYFISAATTLTDLFIELVHETMQLVRLFYPMDQRCSLILLQWILPFCHVYAISDPGNSRYTGVLPLLKGRALHQTMTNTIIIERDPREYLLHRRSSNSHNYIMQHIGVPSGKSKDHLYSYPVTDITFDNLATSILYPSIHMSCGANDLVTVIL